MSQCQAVCAAKSNYNAVNIKINNPKANMSDKLDNCGVDGDFNAVNLEINNPELRQKPVYSYPEYDELVTADMANIMPVDMPQMSVVPVAYEASYVNRTYISPKSDTSDLKQAEVTEVPEPFLTTVENEKKNNGVTFNGLSFKAAQEPNIVPDAGMKPAVNVEKVVNNLASKDYDVQAKQLEEIIFAALKDEKKAIAYITVPVFSGIIDIAEKDTSSLEGPDDEQIDIRKKIITNQIILEQQLADNKKPEEIKLPYELTEADLTKAMKLSELELAERNKEYAILTLSALAKVYINEFEAKTGVVVPLTDVPGASVLVNTLKTSDNPSVKAAAIEALVYINRPEYKDEIAAVLNIVSKDDNKGVAMIANEALRNLD